MSIPSLKEYVKARGTILKAKGIISEKCREVPETPPPLGSIGLIITVSFELVLSSCSVRDIELGLTVPTVEVVDDRTWHDEERDEQIGERQ